MKDGRRAAEAVWIVALAVALSVVVVTQLVHAAHRDLWISVGVGQDVGSLTEYRAASVEVGAWPARRGWGWSAYAERGSEELNTIGFEATWRYQMFFAGVGPAYSDGLTEATGTRWNFSVTPLGVRFGEERAFFDILWRHRSHGADLGIAEDEPNAGINLLVLRAGARW